MRFAVCYRDKGRGLNILLSAAFDVGRGKTSLRAGDYVSAPNELNVYPGFSPTMSTA